MFQFGATKKKLETTNGRIQVHMPLPLVGELRLLFFSGHLMGGLERKINDTFCWSWKKSDLEASNKKSVKSEMVFFVIVFCFPLQVQGDELMMFTWAGPRNPLQSGRLGWRWFLCMLCNSKSLGWCPAASGSSRMFQIIVCKIFQVFRYLFSEHYPLLKALDLLPQSKLIHPWLLLGWWKSHHENVHMIQVVQNHQFPTFLG